jgi:hypothetical protein
VPHHLAVLDIARAWPTKVSNLRRRTNEPTPSFDAKRRPRKMRCIPLAGARIQTSNPMTKARLGLRFNQAASARTQNSSFVRKAISVRLRALIFRMMLRTCTLTVHSPMLSL